MIRKGTFLLNEEERTPLGYSEKSHSIAKISLTLSSTAEYHLFDFLIQPTHSHLQNNVIPHRKLDTLLLGNIIVPAAEWAKNMFEHSQLRHNLLLNINSVLMFVFDQNANCIYPRKKRHPPAL